MTKILNNTLAKEIPILYIYIKDLSGCILDVNETAAKSLNCDISDVRGIHTSKLFPDKLWKKYLKDDLRVAEKGALTGIVEPMKLKNQTNTYWIRTDKLPLKDKSGNIHGVIVYAQDITSFIRSEEQYLHELNSKKLELAKYTHELYAPLAGLPMLIQSLQQIDSTGLSVTNKQCINSAMANAKLTYELLKKIIEKQNPECSLEQKFNFFDLVTDVVASRSESASESATTICMTIKKNYSVTYVGDVRKLRSIFSKLIEMSICISSQGEIEVNATCDSNSVLFEVTTVNPVNPDNKSEPLPLENRVFPRQQDLSLLRETVRELGGNLVCTCSDGSAKLSFKTSLKPTTFTVTPT